jgi:DNA ligase-4
MESDPCVLPHYFWLMEDIVFDIVYINRTSLTRYPLRERRNALHRIINPVNRRFEIHDFTKANTAQDIETELRKIIAEG